MLDLRKLQRDWDEANAIAPMEGPPPTALGLAYGCGITAAGVLSVFLLTFIGSLLHG